MSNGDNFDLVWNYLPHISFYQIVLLCAASTKAVLGGFWTLWVVFGFYKPNVRCMNGLDEFENPNLTWHQKREFLGVGSDINCFSALQLPENIAKCSSYNYDTSDVNEDMFSALMEFNFVCGSAWIPPFIKSMTFVGFFLGAGLSGYLSETYGRKKIMLIFTSIVIIAGIGLAFTKNWWSFLIVWVILQSSNHLAYISMSVYIVEIVGPSKRRWAALGSIWFGVGYVLLSAIAYGIPHWRTFTWSLALISTFCLPIIWLIPISPKWLHSKGRKEESLEILKRFAEKTNTDFSDEIERIVLEDESTTNIESTKSIPLINVMKNSYFRIVALVMGYTFVATTILYYGIAYNAAGLPGNLYLNNSISGFVEIAAYIAIALSMAYLGRKPITCGSIIFASIVCVMIGILLHFDNGTSGIQSAYQWLGFLGKFLISGTFAVIYIWAPEIYPTEARTTGLGLGSMAARIGGVAAPQVIPLQETHPWLPYTIFGIITFTAGLAALWLPETFQQPIHQTLSEAEKFYRNQKKSKRNNGVSATDM